MKPTRALENAVLDSLQRTRTQLPRVRCHYDIVTPQPLPNVVAIRDMDDGMTSVTNDVENVVRQLAAIGVLRDGVRLVYRDSMQRWDEIVVVAGEFEGFRALGAASLNDAIDQLK